MPGPFPVVGIALCWCGEPHAQDDERGHTAIGRQHPPSTRTGADGATLTVYGAELVDSVYGPYLQRRAYITSADGEVGHLTFHPRHDGWGLTWGDDAGWRLVATTRAAQRGWLRVRWYGPDTYGHTDYYLP